MSILKHWRTALMALTLALSGGVAAQWLGMMMPPASALAPADIPGCTHWDSAIGVSLSGATVTGWTDTRGVVTLGTTGAPQYSGARIVTDGIDDSIISTTWAHGANTQATTLWLVASVASSAGEDMPISLGTGVQTEGNRRGLYRESGGSVMTYTVFGPSFKSTLSWDLGGPSHIWYGHHPGGTSLSQTVGKDGIYQTGNGVQTPIAVANGIVIGGWQRVTPLGAPYWAALSVRHAVVCVGTLTTDQRDSIHAYLVATP